MKAEIIKNGTLQIVLTPEDDLDRAALAMMSKSGGIESTIIDSQTQVLNKIIHEGLIISTKSVVNNQ
jgi:hypothetical protein